MGKISPVSSKYIIHSTINIEGVVDRPDIIGAVFGQTEGLLGADLELRELQRSGRIGRIEVKTDIKLGKTDGSITIPSSLDKAETAIIGAALETIQRIGPCNAKVKVESIEDVRISKRTFVIERAKELLKNLTSDVLPDSQEITDEVSQSVRMMEIQEFGKDRLPAGPAINESEEIIVVEGRADVVNLLKHGFKNVIGMNGTSVPQTIIDLCKKKTVTVFVDGDRGGDLIMKELSQVTEIDYVIKAPDGKEVEELTKKEIHKALRSKIAIEQAKLDITLKKSSPIVIPVTREPQSYPKPLPPREQQPYKREVRPQTSSVNKLQPEEKKEFKKRLEDLIGTRGAYIVDQDLQILGKVPTSELIMTVKNLRSGIYAIIFDGAIAKEIIAVAERANVKYLVAMESKIKPQSSRVQIITNKDLE